jgi:hypothetical protein
VATAKNFWLREFSVGYEKLIWLPGGYLESFGLPNGYKEKFLHIFVQNQQKVAPKWLQTQNFGRFFFTKMLVKKNFFFPWKIF